MAIAATSARCRRPRGAAAAPSGGFNSRPAILLLARSGCSSSCSAHGASCGQRRQSGADGAAAGSRLLLRCASWPPRRPRVLLPTNGSGGLELGVFSHVGPGRKEAAALVGKVVLVVVFMVRCSEQTREEQEGELQVAVWLRRRKSGGGRQGLIGCWREELKGAGAPCCFGPAAWIGAERDGTRCSAR